MEDLSELEFKRSIYRVIVDRLFRERDQFISINFSYRGRKRWNYKKIARSLYNMERFFGENFSSVDYIK